ncbi:hypothetical protein ACFRJ8_16345 [Arthrobacter sp. NPDC056886]|uniref:hypothetical protein n=1 Tax=Arthrobacter sp. NPDC056886 TaxID=3345960 RepID=UPI00366FE420
MKTEISRNQHCQECGQVRTVLWTRIFQKNANGEIMIDVWSGRCPDNHELPESQHP